MKIVKPICTFMGAIDPSLNWEMIETAGRICYQSKPKGNAEAFAMKMFTHGHHAMMEFSNVVVKVDWEYLKNLFITRDYIRAFCGKYLNYSFDYINNKVYVGGSIRAWYEQAKSYSGAAILLYPFYLKYGTFMSKRLYENEPKVQECTFKEIPPELHRYFLIFTCDRGVSHEFVRHRPCSFAQESTRWCNYQGKDMEFIEPWWWDDGYADDLSHSLFEGSCSYVEGVYNLLMEKGFKPQAARAVLPNSLKTQIAVCADQAEWRHIKKLRMAPDAHPDFQRLMKLVPWEKILK